MDYKLPIRSHRKRNILIALASVILVAGAAAATLLVLKQLTKSSDSNSSVSQTQTPAESNRQTAEKLFASGDLDGAKASYEKAQADYESAGNESAAADMKMQLEIIASMNKEPVAPQNTDKTRVVVGAAKQ